MPRIPKPPKTLLRLTPELSLLEVCRTRPFASSLKAARSATSRPRSQGGILTTPASSFKPERYFYSVSAGIILLITLAGFWPFYLAGEGQHGRKIPPELFPLVLVHGSAMTAWVILFLVQSLLIASRNRKLHRKLGWSALVIASAVAITGPLVAIQSVRHGPHALFWGMEYRRFLLLMLTEMAVFTVFVVTGLLMRKRPEIHRAMMLLASLSTLPGATARMPVFYPIFGHIGWFGLFSPILCLGAALLIVHSLLRRAVDKPFALGYAGMVVLYISAGESALTESWSQLATAIFNT